MEKKKRTSKNQFTIYVNYLEKNNILRTGKLNPWDDPKIISDIWENMTDELNATGDGPTRSSHEWKKVFREWKSAVRKRAREKKELTGLEKKFIELTGPLAVEGLELPEAGLIEEVGEDDVANAEVTAAATEFVANKATGESLTDKGPSENEEILVIVEEDLASGPQTRPKKKTPQNPLLTAYRDGQETERRGLENIARALDNVADSINRFCDIYEQIHLN